MRGVHMAWIPLLIACAAVKPTHESTALPALFRRTMCFGPCAAYTAEFGADGKAQLALVRGAEGSPLGELLPGTYTGTFDVSDFAAVAEAAGACGYWDLDSVYDNPMIMDLPAVETTLAGHRVYNRHGGPDLRALYGALDSVVFRVNWLPNSTN
jgi:hypothetical protein